MVRKLCFILVAGIVLRILLSISTFHPDLLAFKLGGSLITAGKFLNLYEFSNPQIAILNYPPAIYWYHGVFNFIFNKIFGLTFMNQFMQVNQAVLGDMLFNLQLLLIKSPYLIFDLLTGLFLMKLFNIEKDKILTLSLWVFNPVSLYATYMMGQFDIIPVFFTVASLVYGYQRRLNLSALMLGFGLAFKIYPLFILIPLSLIRTKMVDKIKTLLLGLIPYLFSILPYLPSSEFRTTALVANQTLKSLYSSISVSGGASIILFLLVLVLLYMHLHYRGFNLSNLWQIYLITLLPFFIFTHHHPQWILWLTPFLIIELINTHFKYLLLASVIFVSFLGSLFFFDPSLTTSIFAPVFPQVYGFPSIWQILNITIDTYMGRSILHTILAASAFYYIYLYFPKKSNVS